MKKSAKVLTPGTSGPDILIRREVERIMAARRDPNAAVSYIFLDGKPQKHFHAAMQNVYSENNRVVIDCSIEHGKTEQISVWRTCIELGMIPDLRFLLLSCKAPLGSKILTQIEELILNPDLTDGRLHRVFPMLRPEDRPRRKQEWNSKAFIIRRDLNSKDPSAESSGLKGTVIGGRKDRIIGDDVMNWQNTFFQTERERSIEWFKSSECLGRVTADGKVVLVNSPWHEEALSDMAWRPQSEGGMGFAHVSFVACDENFDNILWPKEVSLGRVVGFDRARLMQARAEMGHVEFGRCFLGQRITGKTQYFDLKHMEACVVHRREGQEALRNGDPLPKDFIPICTIDPAVGKAQSNETVLFFGGVHAKSGKRRLSRLIAGRMGAVQTAQRVLEIMRFDPRVIFYVEGNAQQDFLIQILKNKKIMAVAGATEAEQNRLVSIIRTFTTDKSKADPDSGIPAMMSDFEAGLWEIPECYEVQRWFRQALEYRPGRHSGDILMASYIFTDKAREFVSGANTLSPIARRYATSKAKEDRPAFAGLMDQVF